MKIDLFFEGKVSREEVSSAFLATLLAQHRDYADWFLDQLLDDIPADLMATLRRQEWSVEVERDLVDIVLDARDETYLVIIENKLFSGARQKHQLRRYYDEQLKKHADRAIIVVFLAPGQIGLSEVEEVRRMLDGRPQDRAAHVSWEDLWAFASKLPTSDPAYEFIYSGLKIVERKVTQADDVKYVLEGERAIIGRIAQRTFERLAAEFTWLKLLPPWRSRGQFTIWTNGTPITMYMELLFDAESDPPYKPVNVLLGDRLRLTMQTQFRPRPNTRRTHPKLREKWDRLAGAGGTVVGGQRYDVHGKGWFRAKEIVEATESEMEERFIAISRDLIRSMEEDLRA